MAEVISLHKPEESLLEKAAKEIANDKDAKIIVIYHSNGHLSSRASANIRNAYEIVGMLEETKTLYLNLDEYAVSD